MRQTHPVSATVLVVEDDPTTAEVVRAYLEREGFGVLVARTGRQALDLARQAPPRLIILDIMIPEGDGFEVAQHVRGGGSVVPILMLSARAEEVDRILGLRIGADDYLVKPFSPRELVARVHALLRRAEIGPRAPTVLSAGDLTLVPDNHEASVRGRLLEVTHFEFGVLLTLMEQPGRVWTRQQLLNRLYRGEDHEVLERTIDVHIARIRDKLEQAGSEVCIDTVRGVGYKLRLHQRL
jgi:DNA-binding response OmpR family regulator